MLHVVALRVAVALIGHAPATYSHSRDANPMALARESFKGLHAARSMDAKFGTLANATMRMTTAEAQLWFSLLNQSSTYLEWGTGGSTVMAAWRATLTHLEPLKVDAIDSSQGWFDVLRSHSPIRDAEAAGSLTFHLGNIGETIMWGNPKDWSKRSAALREKQSRSYIQSIPTSRCCYDLILVDGRFREACALYALRLMHNRTTVLIHDSSRHTNHEAILNYYHVVTVRDTLAVLRPKHGAVARAKSGSDGVYNALFTNLMNVFARRS